MWGNHGTLSNDFNEHPDHSLCSLSYSATFEIHQKLDTEDETQPHFMISSCIDLASPFSWCYSGTQSKSHMKATEGSAPPFPLQNLWRECYCLSPLHVFQMSPHMAFSTSNTSLAQFLSDTASMHYAPHMWEPSTWGGLQLNMHQIYTGLRGWKI